MAHTPNQALTEARRLLDEALALRSAARAVGEAKGRKDDLAARLEACVVQRANDAAKLLE